jgi:hypothetical protein
MSDLIQLDDLQPEALGEVIRARAGEFDKATLRAVEHAWHAGRALLAAKKMIPHGQWGQWLSDNFEGRSHDTARIWMRLAANYESVRNLEDVKHGIKLLDEAPERQAKKAEREAKKLESPPKSLAPATPTPPVSVGTIRNENPPTPAPPTRLERPAWLADPDEMGMPDVDAMPQLPKTNTHHTSANRRTPDARETDRVGLVTIDDPRDYVDGAWYRFDESMGRLFWVTDDAVLERAKEIGQARGLWLVFSDPKPVVEHAVATTPVVGPTKESVSSKPGKVPTLSQLRQTVDAKVDWSDTLKESARDWAAYKMTLAGKDKIRSMESWQKALTRMGNVARDRSVADVCEAIEKAIANGWTGWEHLETSGSRGGSRISTAVRSNRNWDEEIPEWKPTE